MRPSRKIDTEYLANQYRDGTNLNARIVLHQKFSTNSYGWFQWVFEQLNLPVQGRILELGCGAGTLWLDNLEQIPQGWEITVSDFSPGMLTQAQANLSQTRTFLFKEVNARSTPLPFEAAYFDGVIANHMLFHIPEKPPLMAEIRRILKPGGRLYATTIGERHMVEMAELIRKFEPESEHWDQMATSFTLENGAAQLSPWFSKVTLRRYEDGLAVTQAAPLLDYIRSGWEDLAGDRLDQLRELVDQEMELRRGVFFITKDSGIFEAVL
jgi:ubiquinone/menaquinone biosynthesis C-methylase UbiE